MKKGGFESSLYSRGFDVPRLLNSSRSGKADGCRPALRAAAASPSKQWAHLTNTNSTCSPWPKALRAQLPADSRSLKHGCLEHCHSNVTKGMLILCLHRAWRFRWFQYSKVPVIFAHITVIPEWGFPQKVSKEMVVNRHNRTRTVCHVSPVPESHRDTRVKWCMFSTAAHCSKGGKFGPEGRDTVMAEFKSKHWDYTAYPDQLDPTLKRLEEAVINQQFSKPLGGTKGSQNILSSVFSLHKFLWEDENQKISKADWISNYLSR